MDNSTHLVKISTIPCYNSTNNPTDKTLPIKSFINYLITCSENNITTKDKAVCFFACYFNNKSRKEENIEAITMLVLDVDNKKNLLTSLKQAQATIEENLKEYEYFYYTTKSSSETQPRMRVIVFLKDEVSKQKYKNAAHNFIETFTRTFKDSLDIPSTMTINRLWFMPYKENVNQEINYFHNQGKLLDLNTYYDGSLKQKEEIKNQEQSLLSVIKAQPLQITKEQIIQDLKNYPAEKLDNNLWFEALAAIHHQFSGNETGLKIANYWSSLDKRPNQYKGFVEIEKIWDRLSTSKSNVVTWATIKMRIAAAKPKEEKQEFKEQIKLEKIHPSLFPEPNMYFTDDGKPKYKPKCSVNNSNFLFDYYNIKFRYNLISKDIEGVYQDRIIEDMEVLIAYVSGMFAINEFPTKEVKLYISYEAKKNLYNPFKEFVLSKPWDNQDRLQQLYDTIKVDDQYIKIRDIYLRHWLLELMKLTCFNDGEVYQFTKSLLVFQCEKYSVGKTEWFNYLIPQNLRSKFVHDGALLKTNDSMSKLECLRVVICELGEIGQTLRKQDMDSLKAFISTRQDVINRKYASSHQISRRMTIFCATTNDNSFLNNKEGDGRFLVLPIIKCNAYHNIDMQQVYAQLYELYKKEGTYILTEDDRKLQESNNEKFVQPCHIENMVLKVFDFEKIERPLRMNCSEIFDLLNLSDELAIRNKSILNKIGAACRKHNIYKCSHTNKFYMPPTKDKIEF